MCRVRQPYPAAGLARRLPAHLTDHMPIYMKLDVHSAKTHNSKLTPHANCDLMMIAFTRDYKRLELSKQEEEKTQQADEMEWRKAWDQGNVQKWWDMLSNNIREARLETFPKQEQENIGYDEIGTLEIDRHLELPRVT
eukprot:9467337-Pyramimonas_sp.AAC.1